MDTVMDQVMGISISANNIPWSIRIRTGFLGFAVLPPLGVDARDAGESVREGGWVVSPMVLNGLLVKWEKMPRGECVRG
jgi:hypothetical protein